MLKTEKLKTLSSAKIKEYGSNAKRCILCTRQKGSILIGLIITMVIMASLGAGMLYVTTTSTFQELFANNHTRAYYAAESGGRHALAVIRDAYANATGADLTTRLAVVDSKTFTMTNGDTFQISALTKTIVNGTTTVAFNAIGGVSSGFLQAKRQISYNIVPANQSGGGGGTTITELDMNNFSAGSWGAFSNATGTSAVSVTMLENTVSGGTSNETRAAAYYSNPSVNFLSYQAAQNGFLSYDAQVKVNSTADYFLAGLSFRTHPLSATNQVPRGFNVSFMRASSISTANEEIDGIPLELLYSESWASQTGPLASDAYYILLWMDTGNGTGTGGVNNATPMEKLLAYKKLPVNSGVFTSYFSDGMEYATYNATTTWRASGSGTWTRSTTHQEGTYSAMGFLTNSGDISYLTYNSSIAISSPTANLAFHYSVSSTSNVTAAVEISTNGTSWSQLGANLPLGTSFQPASRTITGTGGNNIGNIWIRFRFSSTTGTDRYLYIDGVNITRFTPWSTLLVRLEEKLLTAAEITSGSSFVAGNRVNKVMVYYSTPTSNGSGSHTVATDDNRTGSNPYPGTPNWPVAAGASDANWTLVQWDWVEDEYNNPYRTEPSPHSTAASCSSGSGCTAKEVWTTYYLSNSYTIGGEFGLSAFGVDAANKLFFDDFAVKLPGGGVDGSGTVVQF
jgi:hypothetical protein